LLEAVHDYNDAVRWGRYGTAAAYVPPEARREFAARHGAHRGELQIADYEIVQLDLAEDRTHAHVLVEVTWLLRSQGLLRQTALEQRWEQEGGRWSLARERRVAGTPMPEAAEEPTGATASRNEPPRP